MARPIVYPPSVPYLDIPGVKVAQWLAVQERAKTHAATNNNPHGIMLDKHGVHYCGADGLAGGWVHMTLAYHRTDQTLYIYQTPDPRAQSFMAAYALLRGLLLDGSIPHHLLGNW